MKQITSDQNPRLKKAIRLHESRGRRQQQRIIIFGENEVRLAGRCGVTFTEIFVSSEIATDSISEMITDLEAQNVPIFGLPDALFRKLAFGDRHDGVIATANRPDTSLARLQLKPGALCVVLEAVEKPGNIGAIFRSADAAGVDAVFLADVRCDAFHPNAIRSSLGTVFSIPCVVDSSEAIRDYLNENKIQIAAAKVDAELNYFDIDLAKATAIALGSEHDGLSHAWNGDKIIDVTIPMLGSADSLNVSASASIMVFEARRQRMLKQFD